MEKQTVRVYDRVGAGGVRPPRRDVSLGSDDRRRPL